MKTNNVVKNSPVIDFFKLFHSVLNDPNVLQLGKMNVHDFTRKRNLTFDKLLAFLIFRNGKTSNQDLVKFYNKLEIPECIISKQALSKALRKLNPQVFDYLLSQFSQQFYRSDLVKTYHGYIVLAEDGSVIQAPLSHESLDYFGFHTNQHIKEKKDVKKVSAKMGGLFDVTNGFFPMVTIGKSATSEIPLGFQNLDKVIDCLKDKKTIYLAVRYYGSVELFQFHVMNQMNYCIRAKSYSYKEKVAKIEKDGWVEVKIDNGWLKRLKRQDVRDYSSVNRTVKIRVVKHKLDDTNEHIYFTNLSEKEFSKEEIAKLYSFQWNIIQTFGLYSISKLKLNPNHYEKMSNYSKFSLQKVWILFCLIYDNLKGGCHYDRFNKFKRKTS